jgi:hypothetical protein
VLGVALIHDIRDVEKDFLGEAEPVRQRRDDAHHQHGADDRTSEAFHVGPRALHLQHQSHDGHKEDDEAQSIGQTEDRITQTWSEVLHQLRPSSGFWRRSSWRSFSSSRARSAPDQ